ncbi:uncharacterized protein LOC117171133 [Belonocnema kinseyi]|uniref:uncharacterized protein LOC117171133 n=1 Tax=Belonocnema kinseyi TaxID=2817044 RepID=UPI00143D606C|nr:uncharacterized protein LOC117171133 [Belonocnema kinseyi]
MQRLWQLKLDWDESVPNSVFTAWMEFCDQLPVINNVSVERKALINDAISVQLHGFCDTSECGYGACIYLRSMDSTGNISAALFYAKSRVAPLKTVSLPRLELCGAQLLAKLIKQTIAITGISFEKVVLWSDFTITLHWIHTSSHFLKTFEANRVADIQNQSNPSQWHHIRSGDDPADALSRGQLPNEFVKNAQWFNGPQWLCQAETNWPNLELSTLSDVPGMKKVSCFVTDGINDDLLLQYSSYETLKRVIAYCMRFKFQKRHQGPLTVKELENAEKTIIKLIQYIEFTAEISNLKKGKEIHPESKLLSLTPFLDNDDILRVGGRLEKSDLAYSQKHPILLPRSQYVTS